MTACRGFAVASLVALLLSASSALAQAPRDAARIFPFEAVVRGSGREGGLHRLALPAEVVSQARPDLSDVRIFDATGAEVPYLLDSGARPWPSDAPPMSFEATALRVERELVRGGAFTIAARERIEVALPGPAPEGTRWTLTLDAAQARFVRECVVRVVDASGAAPVELARGTVYRFEEPRRERLSVPLPELRMASPSAVLQIELDGEGTYLEPSLRFEAIRYVAAPVTLSFPLEPGARRQEADASVFELDRPVGVLPDRIRVETSDANFHRLVRVFDVVQGQAPTLLGQGFVYRVRELAGAEQLFVDVEFARGTRLRVEIVDGDSPPLRGLALEGHVRQPALIFGLAAGAMTLRFGGGRSVAPRYDLGFVRSTWSALPGTEEATLGAVRRSPSFEDTPALSFAMRPGRPVDVSTYTHAAPLTIAQAPEGLTRVLLTPELLAFARADLADVRVVDAEGRQWPYLRSTQAENTIVEGRVVGREDREGRSVYTLALPVARAEVRALVLEPSAPFVARAYRLRGLGENGRWSELWTGFLSREAEASGPIRIESGGARVSSLALEVEDGDDAPLDWSRVRVEVAAPRVFVVAPPGDYRVLAGALSADAPRYEVEEARSLVLAVRASEAELGAVVANAQHVAPPWYEAREAGAWGLWAVLALAVLVLGVVTFRLARTVPAPEPGGAGAEPSVGAGPSADADPGSARPSGGSAEASGAADSAPHPGERP
jgi:hypothetical protein